MNEAKIKALVAYLQEGGSLDVESVAVVLGTTPRSVKTIEKYIEAAVEADPELDGITLGGVNPYDLDKDEDEDEDEEEEEEEEEAPAPVAAPAPAAPAKAPAKKPASYRFFYEGADGTSREIEKIESKSKNSIVTFRDKQITDYVSLMIKGSVIEVDIVALRKENQLHQSGHGMTNELLLKLALAAKP